MVCETQEATDAHEGHEGHEGQTLQPGDRVCWQIYDAVHYGTVLEPFNGCCLLIDRGRTYTHAGIPVADVDLVTAEHLTPCPTPPAAENGEADAKPKPKLSKGRARRRSARMRRWRQQATG